MKISKKLWFLTLAVILVVGLLPLTAFATGENVVYISVSYDDKYISDQNGNPIVYVPVPLDAVSAVDLDAYNLGEYWHDEDGDGSYETTALQLVIYAHENLYGGDFSEVTITGNPGSSYFAGGVFGFDENLNYYLNGEYPLASAGWGATSDQIVLEAGDYLDIGSFSSWDFFGDSNYGFHFFADSEGTFTHIYAAEAGAALPVKLVRSYSAMGSGATVYDEPYYEIYYGTTMYDAIGSVTTDDVGCADITFDQAGKYYLWCDGGYGCEFPDSVVSTPAYAEVTVTAAEEEEPQLFDMSGSSMTLGNTLEINVALNLSDVTGEDNYIVVSKEYADGREDVTRTYPQSQWTKQGAVAYVSFTVSAKEMNDKLTVIAYNGAGQQISNPYEDSVAGYCLRMLQKEEIKASPSARHMTLYVDMLNYGAAAQTKWGYNTDAMANAGLTDAQKAYATVVTKKENILQKGDGYLGTSLSLKENILMNVAYRNTTLDNVKYAIVTFVDHGGKDESVTVPVEEFVAQGSSMKYISLECMAVADYAQPVTITLYNAADEAISTTVDSMEGYVARQLEKGADVELYEAILAFGKGAYNFFHN